MKPLGSPAMLTAWGFSGPCEKMKTLLQKQTGPRVGRGCGEGGALEGDRPGSEARLPAEGPQWPSTP